VSGTYKGRQVTVAEHILGGFRKDAKGNSPFTSLTPNAATVAGYGSGVIGVNISALRQAIRSGEVTGVAILNQRQIQRLIRSNSNLSDYWKNLASKWSARDGEFLIRGTVPERFITR
jgi:toxin YqcG